MSRVVPGLCIAVLALASSATVAQADSISLDGSQHTFGFERVSNNADVDVAPLFTVIVQDATLTDDDTSATTDIIVFRFENSDVGTFPGSPTITDVYWGGGTASTLFVHPADVVVLPYDSTAADSDEWTSETVSFSAGASPPNPADVSWTADFKADGDPPPAGTSIDRGEYASFYLVLAGTNGYSDVVSALGSGSLGIALHAQGLDVRDLESDWFQVQVVPEPTTITLLGFGLAGLVAARRRRD